MANGFSFRLEKLLQLRTKEVDQLKRELREKREEIAKVEEEIAMLDKEIEHLYAEEIRIITSNGERPLRKYLVRYREELKNSRKQLRKRLNGLRDQEEGLLAELKTVMKDKKAMENLKSRVHEEYLRELNRKEMRLLDDAALQRFTRKNGETTSR